MGSGPLRDGEVFLLVFYRALWLLCILPVCGAAFRPSLIYFLLSLIKKKNHEIENRHLDPYSSTPFHYLNTKLVF